MLAKVLMRHIACWGNLQFIKHTGNSHFFIGNSVLNWMISTYFFESRRETYIHFDTHVVCFTILSILCQQNLIKIEAVSQFFLSWIIWFWAAGCAFDMIALVRFASWVHWAINNCWDVQWDVSGWFMSWYALMICFVVLRSMNDALIWSELMELS